MEDLSCDFCDNDSVVKLTTLEQGKIDTYFFCNEDLRNFKCQSENVVRVDKNKIMEYVPSSLKSIVKNLTGETLQNEKEDEDIIDSVLEHMSKPNGNFDYDGDGEYDDEVYEYDDPDVNHESCDSEEDENLANELTLEDQLRHSIEREDFIEAARLRDLIEENKTNE